MRIIAGSARGRPLLAPRGEDTRPTQDRVREALFNMLQGRLQDARVLDLFAGSGALGLEALSRGAAHATFVDKSPRAMQVLSQNVSALGFAAQAERMGTDAAQALRRLLKQQRRFDLIFLDPPYRFAMADVLSDLAPGRLLAGEGCLALEHRRGGFGSPPAGYVLLRQRAYGDTELTLLMQEEADHAAVDFPGEL